MAQGLSLGQPQVFQCPNCREFINVSMTHCSYCGVAINPEAASAAADIQAKVAQACSDANYLKIMARALAAFYLLNWIPFMPLVGWGFLILLVVVPVMLVRWWVKYRDIQTGDQDYEKAKRDPIIAAVIWSAVAVLWLAVSVVQAILIRSRQIG